MIFSRLDMRPKRGSFPLLGWTFIFRREMRSKRELSVLKSGKLDMHGHTLFEIFKKLVVMSKKSQVILMYWLFYICSLAALKILTLNPSSYSNTLKIGVGAGAYHSLWISNADSFFSSLIFGAHQSQQQKLKCVSLWLSIRKIWDWNELF